MDWIRLLSEQRGPESKSAPRQPHSRSPFDQDYDRVVFSHPFRRLQDKTQVFPLPDHDFVHTRLTHSLEVSSVGRSLGSRVGEVLIGVNPELKEKSITAHDIGAIVAAGSLAHDVGNPPFGHSGETAISDFFLHNPNGQQFRDLLTDSEWSDVTAFEGNAQGFRILTSWADQGLKLTYATLGAFTKYPRASLISAGEPGRKSQKKYGYFQSEADIFRQVAEGTGLIPLGSENNTWCRHPLAFLVEAADDICYQVIDLEDGCRLGLVSFDDTVDLLRQIVAEDFNAKKFDAVPGTNEKIGVLRAMAIGKLIQAAADRFIEVETDLLNGTYDKALTDDIIYTAALGQIETLSIEKIYRAQVVMEREVAGFEVLGGLLDAFGTAVLKEFVKDQDFSGRDKAILRILPKEIYERIQRDGSGPYPAIMNVLDFVSGLTDSHALRIYRRITGISLSS